jgi:hypothetical protein
MREQIKISRDTGGKNGGGRVGGSGHMTAKVNVTAAVVKLWVAANLKRMSNPQG